MDKSIGDVCASLNELKLQFEEKFKVQGNPSFEQSLRLDDLAVLAGIIAEDLSQNPRAVAGRVRISKSLEYLEGQVKKPGAIQTYLALLGIRTGVSYFPAPSYANS